LPNAIIRWCVLFFTALQSAIHVLGSSRELSLE
jgi:hypothetical protein